MARVKACGLFSNSVIVFSILALAVSIPFGALPAALAWIVGRPRKGNGQGDVGGFSWWRGLAGAFLGLVVSVPASSLCALMIFFPDCG
jgi:hypothetical protein